MVDEQDLYAYQLECKNDDLSLDIDKYPIEKGLRTVDLFGLIDFCCNNQKYIIRLSNLDGI